MIKIWVNYDGKLSGQLPLGMVINLHSDLFPHDQDSQYGMDDHDHIPSSLRFPKSHRAQQMPNAGSSAVATRDYADYGHQSMALWAWNRFLRSVISLQIRLSDYVRLVLACFDMPLRMVSTLVAFPFSAICASQIRLSSR